ncbi:glycosyltransferase family 2 protein [Elongatibacter sediminis]|uniref:Glycosyltransferase n=1 Tax=Elongatibacter sediminis TaxID=3119006 RepID=A0AAW9RC94_9GAMM
MMATDTKVSVIIPVYNTAEYLPDCLESVLGQTLREIEVVVVIDGSPDHSIDVVRGYQQRDKRIVVVNKPVNEGLPEARNSGVGVAHGRYIIHLDSDDFWLEDNLLQDLYEFAESEACDVLRFNGRNYESGRLTSLITNELDLINGAFDRDRELWCYRSVFLYLFRKEFIDREALSFVPEVGIGEDGIFLSSALTRADRVSSTSACYYAYRIRPSGMMKNTWSLDRFIEEETSARLIANNLSQHEDALHDYLFRRLYTYWVSVVCPKVARELPRAERMKLYLFAQDNFLKLQPDSMSWLEPHHLPGWLLHRYFLSSDFTRMDRLVRLIRYLVIFLPFGKLMIQYAERFFRLFQSVVRRVSGKLSGVFWAVFGKERHFENLESLEEYPVRLPRRRKTAGVSAMLRVKNEERRIEACLSSIIDVFDEVVVIDNASEDATLQVVRSLRERGGDYDKIRILSYPHRVARCGPEHASTPENSVRNLAYYYNWCLGQCHYSVVCKWDADMLLTPVAESRSKFRRWLTRFTDGTGLSLGSFPVQTVYIDGENRAYEAVAEINDEIRVFPNSSLVYFIGGELWEQLTWDLPLPVACLAEVCAFEIKDTAVDEFAHWSTSRFKGPRKVREYRNFMRVKNRLHRAGDFSPVQADLAQWMTHELDSTHRNPENRDDDRSGDAVRQPGSPEGSGVSLSAVCRPEE